MPIPHKEYKERYFEEVQIGDELPPLKKDFTLPGMMVYGASTWDFIRIHYDADLMREEGFKGPLVDGQQLGGVLAQLVQDWAGPKSFLRKLNFRNRSKLFPGDSVTCYGVVTNKYTENGEDLVALDLWADNQHGETAVKPASAVVRFSRSSS